ncbi:MAG: response regulator [Chitinophagaceae bacterium]|nr:response regulator [Chitinophagaceae bacterium]
MEKVNVLIVEDEMITALDLSTGLEREGYRIAGIADNAEEAIRLFKEHPADIILMDINIRGAMDGIDTTRELLKIRQAPVIYLTAYTDAATIRRVKKIQPAAFLTKPFSIDNVRVAIELAVSNLAMAGMPLQNAAGEPVLQLDEYIFIKHNYHFVKIGIGNLLYVATDNNYISLVTTERKYLVRLSLNSFLEKIIAPKIVRVHRSYAINMDKITSFNDQLIYLDKTEIPIGRNYRESFLKCFQFR